MLLCAALRELWLELRLLVSAASWVKLSFTGAGPCQRRAGMDVAAEFGCGVRH